MNRPAFVPLVKGLTLVLALTFLAFLLLQAPGWVEDRGWDYRCQEAGNRSAVMTFPLQEGGKSPPVKVCKRGEEIHGIQGGERVMNSPVGTPGALCALNWGKTWRFPEEVQEGNYVRHKFTYVCLHQERFMSAWGEETHGGLKA